MLWLGCGDTVMTLLFKQPVPITADRVIEGMHAPPFRDIAPLGVGYAALYFLHWTFTAIHNKIMQLVQPEAKNVHTFVATRRGQQLNQVETGSVSRQTIDARLG